MREQQPPDHPTFREALAFWWKLGWISFGGPAGQIALMHEYLVTRRRWISNSRFLHALQYCMFLPGPEAQQLATYTGWLLHGIRGGVAAGGLFILPSILIMAALSLAYATFGSVAEVAAFFDGVKPAVLAIVLLAMLRLGKAALDSPWKISIAIASLVASVGFAVPFPWILMASALPGWLLPQSGEVNKETEEQEQGWLHHAGNGVEPTLLSPRRILKTIAAVIILWLLPLLALYMLLPGQAFWPKLVMFFTQASLVTFGGAYAVLPFVADSAVNRFGWLSRAAMADGLALGESTPGPLIMVLSFVGFMAGYTTHVQDPWMGLAALLLTVYYTFLPGFGFVLAGAPLIERTRGQLTFTRIMRFFPAAVLGVMGQLALMLGEDILFKGQSLSLSHLQLFASIWLGISIVALKWLRLSISFWILASGAAGLLWWLITSYLSTT